MSMRGAVTALLVCLLAVVGLSWAHEGSHPPKNLKQVGDHWTAWDSPAAGPNDYIIQKGDTLWDLSGQWFGDPYLWPQIWDENRYITDSHWIYPGDPLVRPGQPTVVPDEGILPVADLPPEPVVDDTPPIPPQPLLRPVADATDLYCSGYIEHRYEPAPLSIAGAELEHVALAQGDVVYLNRGRDGGMEAGQEFAIVRATDEVRHPEDRRRSLGQFVHRLGKLRVMLVHDTRSTAVIVASCDEILAGDELLAWQGIPVPMRSSMPEFNRYDPTPSGGPQGTIVVVEDELHAVAAGHVIYTDLGRTSGIQPGDVLTLFRPQERELPRLNIGQAVVLTVGVETSSAKILNSVRESVTGDAVEIVR